MGSIHSQQESGLWEVSVLQGKKDGVTRYFGKKESYHISSLLFDTPKCCSNF